MYNYFKHDGIKYYIVNIVGTGEHARVLGSPRQVPSDNVDSKEFFVRDVTFSFTLAGIFEPYDAEARDTTADVITECFSSINKILEKADNKNDNTKRGNKPYYLYIIILTFVCSLLWYNSELNDVITTPPVVKEILIFKHSITYEHGGFLNSNRTRLVFTNRYQIETDSIITFVPNEELLLISITNDETMCSKLTGTCATVLRRVLRLNPMSK